MKKILVPTDFSKLSRSAALYAIDLAAGMKAEVMVVSVVEIEQGSSQLLNWKKLQDQMIKDTTAQADQLMGELRPYSSAVKLSYKSLFGSPIEKRILDFAADNDIDLIVAGTKGATGLKAVVLGSNTAALINRSDIPVIAVPGDVKFQGIDRIVLATDMEGLDREVKEVARFAKTFDAQIDILHIADVQREQRSRKELEAILIRMSGYERISIHVIPSDEVVATINSYVAEHGADLLVMFTHELGLFEKLFGMSRTREMAFQSQVPLLACKRP
jgi:nucleotide-binding universal stress UspA family protein